MPSGKNASFQAWKEGLFTGLENEDKHGLGMRLVGEPGNHRSKGFEDGVSIPITPGIAAIEAAIGKYDPEVPFKGSPKPFTPEMDSGVGWAINYAVQLREWDMGHHRHAKERWEHACDPTYRIALMDVSKYYIDVRDSIPVILENDRWPLRDFEGQPNPGAIETMKKLYKATDLRARELHAEFLEIEGTTLEQHWENARKHEANEKRWQQQREKSTSPER